MARQLNPDEDDPNVDIGRFIAQHSYKRDKKEISIGHIKMDILRQEKGQLVIGEVKKSSKFEESARMQLAFYLLELKQIGIDAVGELMFPKEKKKIKLELTDDLICQIEKAKREILRIVYQELPPPPKRIFYCKNCAYAEFCWS